MKRLVVKILLPKKKTLQDQPKGSIGFNPVIILGAYGVCLFLAMYQQALHL